MRPSVKTANCYPPSQLSSRFRGVRGFLSTRLCTANVDRRATDLWKVPPGGPQCRITDGTLRIGAPRRNAHRAWPGPGYGLGAVRPNVVSGPRRATRGTQSAPAPPRPRVLRPAQTVRPQCFGPGWSLRIAILARAAAHVVRGGRVGCATPGVRRAGDWWDGIVRPYCWREGRGVLQLFRGLWSVFLTLTPKASRIYRSEPGAKRPARTGESASYLCCNSYVDPGGARKFAMSQRARSARMLTRAEPARSAAEARRDCQLFVRKQDIRAKNPNSGPNTR